MAKAAITYTWQGKDRKGNKLKGEISATSLSEAKNLLRRQGISANRVKKFAKPLFGAREKKITAADISVFSRQIATMLSAGVTLIQSLDMVAQGHAKASMRKLLNEIANEVRSGNPLSNSLRAHPEYFDDLYLLQKEAVMIIKAQKPKNKFLEDYYTVFKSTQFSKDQYRECIEPLLTIANNNGFQFMTQ